MGELNELLNEFRDKCKEIYKKKLADEKFPHPHNLPVSLLGCIDMGRLETANTKTLAYLLNGNELHGLGFVVLEELIKRIGIDNCQSIKDCSVFAEKPFYDGEKIGRFDIIVEGVMIISTNQEKPFEIVIEAKIDSKEGNGQLKKYDDILAKDQRKRVIKKVFLTIEKKDPSEKDWDNILWSDIADVIWSAINKDDLREACGYQFARYYISSIYSNIYNITTKDANIYNVISKTDVCPNDIDKLNQAIFDFNLYQKFPNTVDFIYHNFSAEDSLFDKSYYDVDQKIMNFLVGIRDKLKLGNKINNYQSYKSKDYWSAGYNLKDFKIYFQISLRNFYNQNNEERVFCVPYIYCYGSNWIDKKLLIKTKMISKDIYFINSHNIALAKIAVSDLGHKTAFNVLKEVQNLYDELIGVIINNKRFFRSAN